jgi:DNA-binding NarL/FixJ family response regulator
MAALHSLRVGARFVDPSIGQPLQAAPRLSGREREVLRWLVAGQSNIQIATRIGVSQETVKSHVSSVLGKLGVANRQQAALLALRTGLLDT